ncbi:MAG TPA: Nif3-like dinuclear metal center hexameric protein [Candidatus Egerieimonas intestinavium]|uniref:GTP cyclohydrolase 1 type 2 homolog n=1 Tax=Candidatus Egerieimonas intestinavium TaxID=2840777 RepID=A0A9D1JGY5_9FIRM|nr:Nif3-like dinuclear metal center hexameric protein [Candidatus Egerieimonas intestinavium]
MRNAEEIIRALEQRWPKSQACEWDNVGLLAGRRDRQVDTVFVALDVTEETLQGAVDAGAQMMVTHHPLLFSPVKQINDGDFMGRRLLGLIEHQVTYYAMHTNFDVTGMGELNRQALGIEESLPLEAEDPQNPHIGIGRVGDLREPVTLEEFARRVKEGMKVPSLRVYGDPGMMISRAAVCGGSGKSVIGQALEAGAQALVTGDVDYHTAIDTLARGMAVIDPGHYGSEYVFISYMAEQLRQMFPDLKVEEAAISHPYRVV